MDFTDKAVLVTGAGRRGQVGEAVAAAFAERGARLLLVSRDGTEARALADDLVARGREAVAFAADLTDEAAVAALAGHVREATDGRLHALVHLAGGFAPSGPLAGSDAQVWATQHAINATTAYLTARAMLPMLRAGSGAIVLFASEAVLPGASVAGISAYAAAKSAVVSLMRSIAEEEGPHGVRANAVAPAAIRTAATVAAMGDSAVLVPREAVADAVLLLCSELARRVTGQLLPVR